MNEPRTHALHVRISEAARAKLMERAEREKRKLASLLAIILEEAAANEDAIPRIEERRA